MLLHCAFRIICADVLYLCCAPVAELCASCSDGLFATRNALELNSKGPFVICGPLYALDCAPV
jgi:hypothetical protein